MAYLSKFKHDVFVSYAHVDNEPVLLSDGKLCGWVDVLIDKLEREVKARLGSKALRIWVDHQLAENRPLTPELVGTIRESGTLLVIMSPGYLNSEWCKRERREFLSLVQDRVAMGSVFVVHARKVDGSMPDEFGDLTGFSFWTNDPEVGEGRPLGMPDPNESAFVKRVYNLSHKLKEQLVRLNTSSVPPASAIDSPGRTTRGRVYVARSTEDLEDVEDDLKNFIEQAGYDVLPTTQHPITSAEDFERAMRGDLTRCTLFVQLLSLSRGRELAFAPGKRLPAFQDEIARRCNLVRIQWRERGLDVESVKDPLHRSLLDGARACGLEELKRSVLQAAVSQRAASMPPLQRGVAVFVNADVADSGLAEIVGRELAQIGDVAGFGVDCFLPLREGKPETVRLDFEKNLRECDGLLLVYGDADADWVRTQLRQGRKILCMRDHPLLSLAVLEGPPPDKSNLAVAVANLALLDCRNGLDRGVLSDFVQSLQRVSAP